MGGTETSETVSSSDSKSGHARSMGDYSSVKKFSPGKSALEALPTGEKAPPHSSQSSSLDLTPAPLDSTGGHSGHGIAGSVSRSRRSSTEDPESAETLEQFVAYAGPSTAAALSKLNADIRKQPGNALAFIERSEFLRKADKPELALLDADKAVALSPNNLRARRNRGECLELLEREEEAMKDHEFILKSRPTDKHALLSRGLFYISRNENQKAIDDFSKLIDSGVGTQAPFLYRAKAHENLGQLDKALEGLEVYMRNHPDEVKVIPEHLELAIALHQWKKAMKDVDTMLAHFPRDSTLHMTRGDICVEMKDYKSAIAEYTIASEIEPSFAKVFEKRAIAYEKNNQRELAIRDRERVEELRKVRPDREQRATE